MSSLLISENDCILSITLNRPKTHNALTKEMIHDLKEAFESVKGRSRVRAVLLKSEGVSFCAGADLNYMKSMSEDNLHDNLIDAQKLFDMFDAGNKIPVPMVGELKGNVFGGGLGLAAICDIALATDETQFCFSEVKLGLVPAVISPFVLKKIPSPYARELMLTARRFDAVEAQNMGLIRHTGSSNWILEKREQILSSLIHNGPNAVKATKALLNDLESGHLDPASIREKTSRIIAESRMSQEGQDGMRSFFDKHTPEWVRLK